MSSEFNKSIIKKAQDFLKEKGHDVKTGHLYEIFSKLAGENSWNVASTKQTSFLQKILNPFKAEDESKYAQELWFKVAQAYIQKWEAEISSEGRFLLGMLVEKEDIKDSLEKDMTREPNALFCGSMGSGKSVGMSFTLGSYLKENPDNTLIFLVDPIKGGAEYKFLFDFPKVIPVLNSEKGVIRTIELIYDEAMARREAFLSVQAEDVKDYERITNKPLDRILLSFEEFQSIPYYILNFEADYKTPMTVANKLHTIMRVGRSLGIWVFACAQKATKIDIPAPLISNFTQKMVFRMSSSESSYLINTPDASKILPNQKGLCLTDYGAVQFPFFSHNQWVDILKSVKRQKEIHGVYLNNKDLDIGSYLKEEDNLYKLKKLEELARDIEKYDGELVIQTLHSKMNHSFEVINSKTNDYGLSMVIEWPNKGKVAVMVRTKNQKVLSKHILRMAAGMRNQVANYGIIYTFQDEIPSELYKMAQELNIELVDHEDLISLAIKHG